MKNISRDYIHPAVLRSCWTNSLVYFFLSEFAVIMSVIIILRDISTISIGRRGRWGLRWVIERCRCERWCFLPHGLLHPLIISSIAGSFSIFQLQIYPIQRANGFSAPRLTLCLEGQSIPFPDSGQGILVCIIQHVIEIRDKTLQFVFSSLYYPVSVFLQVEPLGMRFSILDW